MKVETENKVDNWDEVTASLTILAIVLPLIISGCQRSTPPSLSPPKQPVSANITNSNSEAHQTEATIVESTPETGIQLYARHCGACHGEQGDGNGLAAKYLFPKPRDFRTGRFRLVSTSNNVPSREDLHAVLLRGMPGSSMPPWGNLSQVERDLLVDEVLRLRQSGARDTYIAFLKDQEELTDEEIEDEEVQTEIQEYVDDSVKPSESSKVPEFSMPTPDAIERGNQIYVKNGCISCHGKEGKGDGVQKMLDDEKLPTTARDLTLGIYKGGHDPASIYRRIAYGMPGTPMPKASGLTDPQLTDLIHFIRSLSSEEERQASILNRLAIVVKAVDEIPDSDAEVAWTDITPVHLRVMPLWWRDDANPDLTVQAVHDGTNIVMRLSWRDQSEDGHAARSESFEDAVAVQLYRGEREPFIGMGGPQSPIDVWFWDADRQGTPLAVEELYPNMVVDRYPLSEKVVTSREIDRKGVRTSEQPEVSLPARASGNQIVPTNDQSGASSLTVGGPGSVTFRIPQSQLVTARGKWKDGRWTVIMKRSLAVKSNDDGILIKPGDHLSASFAVWDGSQQDRDGKKLVTIWQDLILEQ